jgi:hypothetical protein
MSFFFGPKRTLASYKFRHCSSDLLQEQLQEQSDLLLLFPVNFLYSTALWFSGQFNEGSVAGRGFGTGLGHFLFSR